MLPADEDDFSAALRAEFPNIRFVRRDYWERRRADGKALPMEPPELELKYFNSLSCAEEIYYTAWLEPDGWEPEWYEHVLADGPLLDVTGRLWPWIYLLRNEPTLQFEFHTSRIFEEPYPKVLAPELAAPLMSYVAGGGISGVYLRDDVEHKRFLGRVWRILNRLTTNRLMLYNMRTRKPVEPREPEKGLDVWAGHHAVAWCRANADRYVDHRYRPSEI